MRLFRFTFPALNYIFVAAVMSVPFFALRHILNLPRIPRVLACIAIFPVLGLILLMTLFSLTCSPEIEWRHYSKGSCIQEVARVQQQGYSVHLLHDCGFGAPVSDSAWLEQRRPLIPGLYLRRVLDDFDPYYGDHQAALTTIAVNRVRLQIPVGLAGTAEGRLTGNLAAVDRVYELKRHVYF
jgi:hypothetical protein